MNRLRRWLIRSLWTLGIATLLLIVLIVDFLRFGGVFTPLPTPQAEGCISLPLQASAEDIQLDRVNHLGYLSLLDRRGLVEGPGQDGDIGVIDLRQAAAGVRSALSSKPLGFRPHGMSLYALEDGRQRLFVISHPPDGSHIVEIFEKKAADERFTQVQSVRHPLFQSPNAIVATGPMQFYLVNDSGAQNGFDRLRETLFRAGLSTLVFFDGEEARVVAAGLKSGVGLGISPDGQTLYVAETLGKRIAVFDRTAGSETVTLAQHIATPGSPDNIQIEPNGTLWVAVHAKLLDLIRHFGNADHAAPTLILRYTDQWVTAHLNPGELLSAGSVGAVHESMLWIGSITETKVLQCPM